MLLKLVEGNILGEESPLSKIFTESSVKADFSSKGKEQEPRSSRLRQQVSEEDSVQQNQMLSRLLEYNVQTINEKEKSLEKTKKKLAELKLEPGKLVTLREINGASVEYKQSQERRKKEPEGAESSRRLSYFEKLKLGSK